MLLQSFIISSVDHHIKSGTKTELTVKIIADFHFNLKSVESAINQERLFL